MFAALRSVASSNVGDDVRGALSRPIVHPLARKLGGKHAEQRAAMIVAQSAGFNLFRRIVGVRMMSPVHSQELSTRPKTALDGVIATDRHN